MGGGGGGNAKRKEKMLHLMSRAIFMQKVELDDFTSQDRVFAVNSNIFK